MKYFIILSAMMLFVSETIAQNCNYSFYGTVKEASTGFVLPGATISLAKENKVALTDHEGHFHFNNLCPGEYVAQVSYIGFIDREIKLNISKNQEVEISLNINTNELAEVRVISSTNAFSPLQTTNKLSGNSLALTLGESLGESLKRLPGINSIQTGPTISKPVIHGMHSNRVVLYNAGVRLEGQQWGSEHAPEIDPFLANEITVVKGASSIQYGPDALGGVILIEPEPLNFHKHLAGNFNLVGATVNQQGSVSADINGASKKETFAWRIQSTLKKGGNAKTPNYHLGNTGFNEVNGSFTLGYKKKSLQAELFASTFNTTLGIFEGAHIGSVSDLNAAIANERPFNDPGSSYDINAPKQEVSHQIIKLKGKKVFANNAILNFNYSFQNNKRKEYDIRRGGRSDIPALDLVLNAQNLEVIYETANNSSIHTKYGINVIYIVNNNVPGTFAIPLIPNYNSINPAAFLIKRLEKEKYELELGLRYDYKYLDAAGYNKDQQLYGGKNNFHNISGSLGGLWKLNELINLRTNAGLSWRAPSVNELYSDGLHHGSASIEIGNINLNSEKGYKWINSLVLNSERFTLDLGVYANYIKDYIYLQPSGTFEESLRGAFPVFNYQQSNALFLGSDLSTSYNFSSELSWNLKAAVVRAKDRSNNNYLPMIPADKIDNSIRWSKTYLTNKFNSPFLELQHVYVAKQNRFDSANEFTAPPAGYNLLNISGGFSYKVGENNLGVNASIFNLLNNEYKDYLNRFRYYAHETGRNFVLRLNYKF